MSDDDIRLKRQYDNLMRDLQPLECYLADSEVTDIATLADGEIVIEKFCKGKEFTGIYLTEGQTERITRSLATVLHKEIESSRIPTLEGVIPHYNARIQAVFPPWTKRTQVYIRRPAQKVFTLEQYVDQAFMTEEQYDVVTKAIKARKNIMVGGATGSGKSTFLNAVLHKMVEYTPDDRFLIIEDVPELQCAAHDAHFLLTRSKEASEAIASAMRMKPRRIIFGELRYGSVANELLKAWQTGHPGNATTIHAESAPLMLARIQGLLREVIIGSLPPISDAIHVCVHLTATETGPKVNEILDTSISGLDEYVKEMQRISL